MLKSCKKRTENHFRVRGKLWTVSQSKVLDVIVDHICSSFIKLIKVLDFRYEKEKTKQHKNKKGLPLGRCQMATEWAKGCEWETSGIGCVPCHT